VKGLGFSGLRLQFNGSPDPTQDFVAGSAKLKIPGLFDIGAGLKFVAGKLDGFKVSLNNLPIPVRIPPIFAVSGGELAIDGFET
jgi:hypothetical protein